VKLLANSVVLLSSTVVIALTGAAIVLAQGAGQPQRPPVAEQVFKNIQTMKGVPADEFMTTMGVFSAALGMSCEDCHASNDSKWENYALDTSVKKRIARRMIAMMGAINKEYFNGRQVVTCYTCHRGTSPPRVTPNLSTLYTAPIEPEHMIVQAPNVPTADQIFDKYIQAIGGPQKLAALTSLAATGTSAGYGPESDRRPVEIYAKAPGQRMSVIHTSNGDSTNVFDGRSGWIAAPLKPIPVLAVSGQALEGVKLEAAMFFPGRIKSALGKWRSGFPATIDDRDLQVVQGTGDGGLIATFYFDPESGLLARMVYYSASVVGAAPTKIDYSDYREVAGVKMPFRWTVAWVDGKETWQLNEVQPNVPIDAAKFVRPLPPAAK
jgi:outer membrane lipoprotein-sorting protein